MLAAGLEQTLVATGQDDNVVVIRRSSQTEVQSGIPRLQAGVVESLPQIAVTILAFAVSVALAAASWKWLEQPILKRVPSQINSSARGERAAATV